MLHPAVKVIQLIYFAVSVHIALSSFQQIFETSRNSCSQMFQDDAAVLIGQTYYIISHPVPRIVGPRLGRNKYNCYDIPKYSSKWQSYLGKDRS